MIGNDVDEDMTAEQVGMSVFLLTDNMINRKNKNIYRFSHGGFAVRIVNNRNRAVAVT